MIPEIPTLDLSRISASAIQEVLATQFKLSAVPVSLFEIEGAADDPCCLTACVNLHGALMSGSLRLQLPEAWVHKINASLLGQSDAGFTSENDDTDLTGELCNMLAGRVAAALAIAGYSSTLSTPSVIRGQSLPLQADARGEISLSDWVCEGHVLRLTVLLTYKTI
jgi:CheY-specific phosphatase CheX